MKFKEFDKENNLTMSMICDRCKEVIMTFFLDRNNKFDKEIMEMDPRSFPANKDLINNVYLRRIYQTLNRYRDETSEPETTVIDISEKHFCKGCVNKSYNLKTIKERIEFFLKE